MKVQVVCEELNTERILSRLATTLANLCGWDIGTNGDMSADVNYAFPYLNLRKWSGEIVAFFTHREDVVPAKVEIWKKQAAKAKFRITCADMYLKDLLKYGYATKIYPPLDRDKFNFRPDGFKDREGLSVKPVAGVSGFVYGGGRKGESLLSHLLRKDIAKRFEWRGSGRGWPINTKNYTYQQLHEFFWGLDLFICTSIIEGIPYPPLEAMACGIRCIVPRDVGLLDELPDIPDIIRYEKGNIDSLAKAVEKAEKMGDVDKNSLREVTKVFTTEGWINGHLEVMSRMNKFNKSFWIENKLESKNKGFFIVAFGEPARECARRLIGSIRRFMPGYPVAVSSDRPMGEEDFFAQCEDFDLGGRSAKILMYKLVPKHWDYAVYLDADTEMIEEVSWLFKALEDGWDLVISKDINDYDKMASLYRRDFEEKKLGFQVLGSDSLLQLAGGVIGFRKNNNVGRFFDCWLKEWQRMGRRDQGALVRALYPNPIKVYVVSNEWNSFLNICDMKRCAGIIHHREGKARRWRGRYPNRLDSVSGFAQLEGYKIENEELDYIFELLALKTFQSEHELIRKGSIFRKNGHYARELIYHKLAYCLKKIDKKGNEILVKEEVKEYEPVSIKIIPVK